MNCAYVVVAGNVGLMPTPKHEALTELFRHRPALAAEILERFLHLDVPGHKEARLAGGDLPKLMPAERRADAVVMLHQEPAEQGDQARPALAIAVEVQLRVDRRKRRTWPDYLTGLHSRYECPAILLVVCPERRTAAWAAEPIVIGHPEFVLRPLVLGPDRVPVITDVAEAVAGTELAVLSGIAHGTDQAVRNAVFTALAVFSAQDMNLAALYADVIVTELPMALRKMAEEELRAKTREYGSDFAKSYHAQGKREGREEGRAEGEAKSVLTVLATRGIEVTPDQESRIRQCTDLEQLSSWLRRAVTAESADQVLA
jgi:hypothetical protein